MATNGSTDLFVRAAWTAGVLKACGPCVSQRRNVLVTGIAGAGKTTLIKSLARLLSSTEPVLVLDDCEELGLAGSLRKLIHLRCRDSAESTREAVARALRGAPRRLVFGNVCPPEAGEVLRALGSGRHHGSLLAMGATSAETALRQLATWSLADGFSWEAACAAIPTAIHVVVRLDREANGNRRAAEVSRVEAAEGGWALCPLRPPPRRPQAPPVMNYSRARKDHEYLWGTYAPACDMTGAYVDQDDLADLLRIPTKATAARCYGDQIRHWFHAGPELSGKSGDEWKSDPEVAAIADRHEAAGDYVLLGGLVAGRWRRCEAPGAREGELS